VGFIGERLAPALKCRRAGGAGNAIHWQTPIGSFGCHNDAEKVLLMQNFGVFYLQGGPYMHLLSLSAGLGIFLSLLALRRPARSWAWFLGAVLALLTGMLGVAGTTHGLASAYEHGIGHWPTTAQEQIPLITESFSVTMHPLLFAAWLGIIQLSVLAAAAVVRWQTLESTLAKHLADRRDVD